MATTRAPFVVATGGLAEMMRPLCETLEVVAPFLTLEGLRIAYDAVRGPSRDEVPAPR